MESGVFLTAQNGPARTRLPRFRPAVSREWVRGPMVHLPVARYLTYRLHNLVGLDALNAGPFHLVPRRRKRAARVDRARCILDDCRPEA